MSESPPPSPEKEPEFAIYWGDAAKALGFATVITVFAVMKGGCGTEIAKKDPQNLAKKEEVADKQ